MHIQSAPPRAMDCDELAPPYILVAGLCARLQLAEAKKLHIPDDLSGARSTPQPPTYSLPNKQMGPYKHRALFIRRVL